MGIGKHNNRLPNPVRDSIGAVKLEKGHWQDVKDAEKRFYLIAWDFAFKCRYEDCGLFERCTYVKHWTMRRDELGKAGRTDKCRMQQRYMKSVIYAFVEKMRNAKKTEQEAVIKLGFHLLPLYAQLFKFKLLEIDNDEILMTTARGDQKINPVYKEIREIIKTITTVWKDIGDSVKMRVNPTNIGDSAFIDAMYSTLDQSEENDEEQNTSDKGSAWDFDEEEHEEVAEDGSGIDIEKYNSLEVNKRTGTKNISYIEKTSTKSTSKKSRRKKKPGRPPKKESKEVPSYNAYKNRESD